MASRLVISFDEDESSFGCRGNEKTSHRWALCQWDQARYDNHCQERNDKILEDENNGNMLQHHVSPAREGILLGFNTSDFFQVQLYGTIASIDLPEWPWKKSWLIDTSEWDRHWGAFWVRSQILHMLVNDRIDAATRSSHREGPLDIGIVIDAEGQALARHHFGRNSTKTHHWDRILTLVDYLLLEHGEVLSARHQRLAIHVVTISDEGVAQPPTKRNFDWNFTVISPSIADDDALLQSLGVLREAAFLIGSFASPFFRVATSLNAAKQTGIYPLSMRRHWGLDIEWLECH